MLAAQEVERLLVGKEPEGHHGDFVGIFCSTVKNKYEFSTLERCAYKFR